MKDWLTGLEAAIEAGHPATLVTIANAKGSSPREAGVKMLVTETDSAGTVGGGNLEHEAKRIARAMIAENRRTCDLRRFALGPALGQCCGGNTQLLFEPVPANGEAPPTDWIEPLRAYARAKTPSVLASRTEGEIAGKLLITDDQVIGADAPPALVTAARRLLKKPINTSVKLWSDSAVGDRLLEQSPGHHGHILLIGAGHVGKAVVEVMGTLPFAVTWADDRPDQYPEEIAANITVRCTPHLERAIDDAPADTIYLVMTYSHDLDFALCARVLQRGDFRYLGLIGSRTKRARFEKTMQDLDIDRTLVERVVCPIGLPSIGSKEPPVIAVAVAAQLLSLDTPENGS